MKNVLILVAHPDDDILGVGGAMQFYRQNKYNIYVCVVTDGSSTQYKNQLELAKIKDQEHRRALSLLGVEETFYLGFPDMKLDTVPHYKINDKLIQIVKQIKPEILFTHNSDDLNKDHRLVYDSTLVAIRPLNSFLKRVYSYEVLSSSEWVCNRFFAPNHFIDIEDYIAKKQQAFAIIKTEVREYPHPRSINGIEILARYRGMQSGLKFAEAFKLIRSYE